VARLDDRLRRDLERAARPADPSGVYEELIRRRERRRIARKVQAGALAFVVIAGTAAGVYGLSRVFLAGSETPGDAGSVPSNGIIVFSREIRGEGEHLFAASPDGSDVRRLTPDGRAAYRSPDVSPNGRTIVVAHEIPSFEPGQAVLATVPIEGGSPTWLTEETWVVRDPAWSPDGGRIAFAGSPGGPFGIYVFDVMTGDARLVPGTDEISVGHPTWSPDGSRIAFEASTDADTDPDQTWDIYSVGRDGLNMTNLSNTPDASEIQPAWSWVNDQIAFVEAGPAEGALLTMASTGTAVMSVYSGEFAPANPVWSPDGTAIAFEAGSEGIFTVRTNGTALAALPEASGGQPAWQPLPEGTTAPTPTPTPVTSPDPEAGRDIGLGFPVCNVTSVHGHFGDAQTVGIAYVATKRSDVGPCPNATEAFNVVAIDITGDGEADASYGPVECQPACTTFAAPDIDGDGIDELLVQNVQFSIAGLKLFKIGVAGISDSPFLNPAIVAPPGDPAEGFDPGKEPQLWLGGDAFELDALRCESGPDGRVLVATTAESRPHDSPDAVWFAHETTFMLGRDGTLTVIGTRDFQEPATSESPSFATRGGLCGASLPYPYGGG